VVIALMHNSLPWQQRPIFQRNFAVAAVYGTCRRGAKSKPISDTAEWVFGVTGAGVGKVDRIQA
jgi:hypothetical protein